MSQIDESFEALRKSLQSILPETGTIDMHAFTRALVLELPTDVAAFSVFNGHVQEAFDAAYGEFKELYRQHHIDWDKRTLSFVLCRVSDNAADDRFYAEREHDPLFCRKYVIHAHGDAGRQRQELLRLPFLPFPDDKDLNLPRPQSAQDFLQSAGLSPSLARKLIESGRRAPQGIVNDLLEGKESIAGLVRKPEQVVSPVSPAPSPMTVSRLAEARMQSFRAYRKEQTFDLNASVVVLYGPNGLGKTSFFDAVDYACTGRIGRLCRQRKLSKEEFSRVATYLDDTPGTGSVVLTGHGHSRATDASEWVLRRGTGNWSTAWINGEKSDRLATLTFLTHADWGDTKPRQQNVESLFRATHLFGQDEQELLVEFRRSSVLPEAFVSEMLALQDYAQGVGKSKDVSHLLVRQKTALETELANIREERDSLSASLPNEVEPRNNSTQETVDDMVSQLRRSTQDSSLNLSLPEDPITPEVLEEWLAIVEARVAGNEKQLGAARALRNELPTFHRLSEDFNSLKQKLATQDAELNKLASEAKALETQTASIEARNTSANSGRIECERRSREVKAVIAWQKIREEREQQLKSLESELRCVEEQCRDAETTFQKHDAELKMLTKRSADDRNRKAALQDRHKAATAMIEGFSAHAAVKGGIDEVQQHIKDLDSRRQQEHQRVVELRQAAVNSQAERKNFAPEYERAKAMQDELTTLLDSIQSHLSGTDCPLCGTDFASHEALLDRVREQRSESSKESSVSAKFMALKKVEADAQENLSKAIAAVEGFDQQIREQNARLSTQNREITDYVAKANAVLSQESASVERSDLESCRASIESDLSKLNEEMDQRLKEIDVLEKKRSGCENTLANARDRKKHLEERRSSEQGEFLREEARAREVFEVEGITTSELENAITSIGEQLSAAMESVEECRQMAEKAKEKSRSIEARTTAVKQRRQSINEDIKKTEGEHADFRKRLNDAGLPANTTQAGTAIAALEDAGKTLRQIASEGQALRTVLSNLQSVRHAEQLRNQIQEADRQITEMRKKVDEVDVLLEGCKGIESLLRRNRQVAVENHMSAYGPLTSNIQQRLRSVYGFGGVHLEARGGETTVQVEWRNKDIQLRPTDFFSDSQKQILMLSVFLAGGLRQTWSGFAPILLDDPVTHFDDLNAYGFVELIRGIVSSKSDQRQFIISTCEDRLFSLMQKKFARLDGGAIFYEFLGMSNDGPIVERK